MSVVEKSPDFCCNWNPEQRCCKALNVGRDCKPCGCSFYETIAEHSFYVEHAQKRLASLDIKVQAHIADKYYNGKRPWTKITGIPDDVEILDYAPLPGGDYKW